MGGAAEHFCVPDFAPPGFAGAGPAVFGEPGALGTGRAAHHADSAVVDDGGRAAFRCVFPWLPANRRADMRGRIRAGAARGLDAADPGAAAEILLPAVDVYRAVPVGEGSGERAPGGMEGRGEGTAGAGAGDVVVGCANCSLVYL